MIGILKLQKYLNLSLCQLFPQRKSFSAYQRCSFQWMEWSVTKPQSISSFMKNSNLTQHFTSKAPPREGSHNGRRYGNGRHCPLSLSFPLLIPVTGQSAIIVKRSDFMTFSAYKFNCCKCDVNTITTAYIHLASFTNELGLHVHPRHTLGIGQNETLGFDTLLPQTQQLMNDGAEKDRESAAPFTKF